MTASIPRSLARAGRLPLWLMVLLALPMAACTEAEPDAEELFCTRAMLQVGATFASEEAAREAEVMLARQQGATTILQTTARGLLVTVDVDSYQRLQEAPGVLTLEPLVSPDNYGTLAPCIDWCFERGSCRAGDCQGRCVDQCAAYGREACDWFLGQDEACCGFDFGSCSQIPTE